jgi:hypothetical protein
VFGGWLAILAVSYMVYRCAAANNRSRLLWVAISWLLIFGAGIAATLIAATISELRGDVFATEREFGEAMAGPAGLGMLAGGIASVMLANRPTFPR